MPPRAQTYFFGRLNLISYSDDKRLVIYEALTSDITTPRGDFIYGFFDAREIREEEERYVFGRLVKYKPLLESEVVDQNAHEVIIGGLPYAVVAKSQFFLHYASLVLAYHPITNRLSDNQFRQVFAKLIEEAHQNFFVTASVESISEDIEITEAIGLLDAIHRITFSVQPSNPSNRDVYRRLDERLKALRAKKIQQTVEAQDEGFDQDALLEDDAYRGLMMAADGYGRGEIEGVTEHRTVVIGTGDSPVRKGVVPSSDPYEILHQLLRAFKRIWGRKRE